MVAAVLISPIQIILNPMRKDNNIANLGSFPFFLKSFPKNETDFGRISSLVNLCNVLGAVIKTLRADELVANKIPVSIVILKVLFKKPFDNDIMLGNKCPVAFPVDEYPVSNRSLFIRENTTVEAIYITKVMEIA